MAQWGVLKWKRGWVDRRRTLPPQSWRVGSFDRRRPKGGVRRFPAPGIRTVRLRITFHGAAHQVTGSAHLLEFGDRRVLLDCGLFDSDRMSPESPNRSFTFEPRDLDAVVVSHAHNDHIGRLPCLARAGYRGPIYTTKATGEILNIMLRDSARIQREDARVSNGRGPNGAPAEPLFEILDVEFVVDHLRAVPYREPTEIVEGVTLTFLDAGHILGSAMIQLDYREDGRDRRFLFTGDLGRRDMGLLPDPTIVKGIDVLVSESTYGGRELDNYDKLMKQLHAIMPRAVTAAEQDRHPRLPAWGAPSGWSTACSSCSTCTRSNRSQCTSTVRCRCV